MAHVPMEFIEKKIPNIYEAVIVAALEARRINAQRLIREEHISEEEDSNENPDQGEEKKRPVIEPVREKVTVLALRRLVNGKLTYSYELEKNRRGR
jgi:DNA-directed RNA polymerase omega subunit